MLLCNYFKYREMQTRDDARQRAGTSRGGDRIDKSAWQWSTYVASCHSIVTGACHWVIRIGPKEKGVPKRRVLAYDPETGQRYDIDRDASVLPLTSIDSVFDQNNVPDFFT